MRRSRIGFVVSVLIGIFASRSVQARAETRAEGETRAEKAWRLIEEAKALSGQDAVNKLVDLRREQSARSCAQAIARTDPAEAARIMAAASRGVYEVGLKTEKASIRRRLFWKARDHLVAFRRSSALAFAQRAAATDPKAAAEVMIEAGQVLIKMARASLKPDNTGFLQLAHDHLFTLKDRSARSFATRAAAKDPGAAADVMIRISGILYDIDRKVAARNCLSLYARRCAQRVKEPDAQKKLLDRIDKALKSYK